MSENGTSAEDARRAGNIIRSEASELVGPTSEDIVRQLSAVLRSQYFRNSPTLASTLRYLVEEALQGRGEQLDVHRVARGALGKNAGFRSSKDSSVRVIIKRLRVALKVYKLTDGRLDDVRIDLPLGTYEPKFDYRVADDSLDPIASALRKVDYYQGVATKSAHRRAFHAVKATLDDEPENSDLMSAYADLLLDAWKHGYGQSPNLIDQAHSYLENACEIDPKNPRVQFIQAFLELNNGQLEETCKIGTGLMAPGNDSFVRGQGAWMVVLASDSREVSEDINPTLFEHRDQPGWIYHAPFLLAYEKGDYEVSLDAAIRFGMPEFYWGYINRAAALGQLGLLRAAEAQLSGLLKIHPHFTTDPERFVSAYVPVADVRQHVIEGLEKAGLHSFSN